jgi:hypothetical protein
MACTVGTWARRGNAATRVRADLVNGLLLAQSDRHHHTDHCGNRTYRRKPPD